MLFDKRSEKPVIVHTAVWKQTHKLKCPFVSDWMHPNWIFVTFGKRFNVDKSVKCSKFSHTHSKWLKM